MSEYELALLAHLLGAITFFAGIAVAAVCHAAARRRDRPGEIATLLEAGRTGVLLVAVGAAAALFSGFWLLEQLGYSLGEGWIAGSLGLLVLATILGAAGGQKSKRARREARRLAQESDAPAPELKALLSDPASSVLNALAAAAALGVLVLMVVRP